MAPKKTTAAAAAEPSEQLSIDIPDGARKPRVQLSPRGIIHPDPAQPRVDADAELRASIATNGIIQPLTVRPHPTLPGEYLIVDGERRWRGAEGILEELPTIIRRDQEDEYRRLCTQLVANTGKPLTPVAEARTYRRMLDAGAHTVEQLARDLGRPRSSIAERLQLLDLGPWLSLVEREIIPVSYAVRALLPLRGLPDAVHAKAIEELSLDDDRASAQDLGIGTYDDFADLIRTQYRQFMYPLTTTKMDHEPQPEFDTRQHDVECPCGGIEWAIGYYGSKPRKVCGNPDWWKPKQKAAKKVAKEKGTPAAKGAPTVKGATEFYLPEGAATINTGYSSTAKGALALTDDKGRWSVSGLHSAGDAFDPKDLVINDAKLVRITSQYRPPCVGTKDLTAVKTARELWAKRWEAREQELAASFQQRVDNAADRFSVDGPGLSALLAIVPLAFFDLREGAPDFDDFARAVGLTPSKAIARSWEDDKVAAAKAWLDSLEPAQLRRLAVVIAMHVGGEPMPSAQVAQERAAAIAAIQKTQAPWTKKPKATPAAKKPSAPAGPAAKKAPARSAPNPTFMRLQDVSPALAAIVGAGPMVRTDVTKKLWDYIRKNDLVDAKNRRQIRADDKLQLVFGGKQSVSMFEMTKLVNEHLTEAKTAPAKEKKGRAGDATPGVLVCVECGCTEDRACEGGCWWVSKNPPLCSACQRSHATEEPAEAVA